MIRRLLLLVLLALPLAAAPTHYNDDTCDIGVLPAATLLLPFFDVDLDDRFNETTLLTVVNVTNFEQIAHVTLWTDRGFPVFGFPVYLTGYDAQSINLFDILAGGLIAPGSATIATRRGVWSDRSTTINTAGCTGIQGGASIFQTSLKIWHEGKQGHVGLCGMFDDNVTKVAEVVRFDEAENAVGDVPVSRICAPLSTETTLPVTSRTSVADTSVYPQLTNGATAGWMYLNLDNCTCDSPLGSSNWVVTSMRSEGRYSVDMDATAMGNGCSQQAQVSEVTTGTAMIGPAWNRY